MGGVVQYHGAEKEEATSDGAMGKEENMGEKKTTQIGGLGFWISILIFFVNLFPTNLGSGSSQFSGCFMLHLYKSEGNRARIYFSGSLLLSSQGDESQMSGHADETGGEQQARVDDGSFTSHPQENNQIFKWRPS